MEADSHEVYLMQDFGILWLCRMKTRERAWRLELLFTTKVGKLDLANAKCSEQFIVYV